MIWTSQVVKGEDIFSPLVCVRIEYGSLALIPTAFGWNRTRPKTTIAVLHLVEARPASAPELSESP